MIQKNAVQVIKDVYADFRSGDMAEVFAAFAENAEVVYPRAGNIPWAGRFRGPRGLQRYIDEEFRRFELVNLQIHGIFGQGENVVSFGTETLKNRETGQTFQTDWLHRWQVREGLVRYYEVFLDTIAVEGAL